MSLSESTAQGSLGRGTRNGETALTYQLKLPTNSMEVVKSNNNTGLTYEVKLYK